MVVHRQPHRVLVRVGPLHPVTAQGWNIDVIAGAQIVGLGAIFQDDGGGAGDHQHPFLPVLLVPEIVCGAMATGSDAFDAHVLTAGNGLECLLLVPGRQICQDIAYFIPSRLLRFFRVTRSTLALIMWANRPEGNPYMLNLFVKSRYRPIPALLLLIAIGAGSAQAQDAIEEADLVGEWRGIYNINIGGDREIIFTVTHDEDGLKATFDDPSRGMLAISVETITFDGKNIRFQIPRIYGDYNGIVLPALGSDGKPLRIDGDWAQAGEFIPIMLNRTLAD